MKSVILLWIMLAFPIISYAEEFGSVAYCSQLAEIGSNAHGAQKEGYSLGTVLQKVGYILSDNPQKKEAAQGVIIAIYGDGSIRSAKQAHNIVYSACKR